MSLLDRNASAFTAKEFSSVSRLCNRVGGMPLFGDVWLRHFHSSRHSVVTPTDLEVDV